MIRAILATDPTGIIGVNGSIPWRSKADMRFFKESTMGGVCIVGRKTWESIPAPKSGGPKLPGRFSLVISSTDLNRKAADIQASAVRSLASAIRVSREEALLVEPEHRPPIWIIGGGQVYAEAFERGVVDEIHLTTVAPVDVHEGAEVTRLDLHKTLQGFTPLTSRFPDGFAEEGLGFGVWRKQ